MTAFEQERKQIKQKIWSILGLHPGQKVLDVGVGRTAYSLAKLIELGAKATSIDLAWRALYEHKTKEANAVQCDAAKIPFRTKVFELSLANFTFHEINPSQHQQGVSELCRVSERIMIVEPDFSEDPVCRRFQDFWAESMHSINRFEDYQTMDYWTHILKSCGVQITVVEKFQSRVRLCGQEARDYMKTVADELRDEGVPENHIKEMQILTKDVAERGMIFSDVNVVIGRE